MNSLGIQRMAVFSSRRKVLEVIVTSREEAMEAELYGADRLEVVHALQEGGLTPEFDVVGAVVKAVSIPVRVMVRERNLMTIADEEELFRLQRAARRMAALPIDGLVLGYVSGPAIDTRALARLLTAAPHCRITFHRAFESVDDPITALRVLQQFPQIDRVLVRLQDGNQATRISDLVQWQRQATPNIQFIVGLGLDRNNITLVQAQSELKEVHAGRLLREPETAWGRLSRRKFLDLKSALG